MRVNRALKAAPALAIVILVLVVGGIMVLAASPHFYFFRLVKEDQVGVKIRGGQIVDVVPPGVYHDIGLFVRMDTISTQEYKFNASDPEVITSDQQRIGVVVNGSVFRPTYSEAARIKSLWTQYKNVYTSDDAMQTLMNNLSFQAMKVCVGDRTFAESVIGSDRDSLRNCIDGELNKLMQPFGLTVMNVVVPNVTLNPEVQARLDEITQSRLLTEKAVQDEKKATAQGKADQAQQEAAIRVEQSKRQEQTRQEKVLAQLDKEKLDAQRAVIESQKSNDLLSAQKDLEIAQARAAAALQQAQADLANNTVLAELYTTHPEYLQLQMALANASAIKASDKFIFTPAGVMPNLVFGSGTGILPTVPLGPVQPVPESAQ